MQQEEYVLRLENISKSFPGVKALDNVCLRVRRGEVHALIGGNGAGKSTLMKILSGAYTKDSGTIWIDGVQTEIGTPKAAEAHGISIIYQELNLIASLSVAENIFIGKQPKTALGTVNWSKMYADAQRLLDDFHIQLDSRQAVGTLNVAQQQMIEIIKAISVDAKVVIMDEPTSSLTTKEITVLFQMIRQMKAKGVAIIFISHRMDEIFEICDYVTIFRDGTYIADRPINAIDRNELIAMMIGREMAQQFPQRESRLGEEVLRVSNFCDGEKVTDVSFDLHKGEVLGFAGLVGAGRTELMQMLFGVRPCRKGEIWLHGQRLGHLHPRQSIRKGFAFVTEDRKHEGLALNMPVRSNICMIGIRKVLQGGLISRKKERLASEKYIKALRIVTPSIEQKVVFLSGGNQQKIVLSKWLMSDADIIIMDEPTRGIDVGAKHEIYEIINQLVAEGKSILFISSEFEEVMGVCDRILVMCEGRITGELQKNEFSQHAIGKLAVGEQ